MKKLQLWISILIGNGVGGFSPATDYPVGTCPCGLSCIKAGDFNNDSKVDLAIANQNSNDVSVIIPEKYNFREKVPECVLPTVSN